MALLFVLDGLLIQFALWLALHLRFVLPLGNTILPQWLDIYFFVPDVGLHLVVGAIWAIGFVLFGVYTPRQVIHWNDEFLRILLAQTVAALSLAGMLYLAKIDLSRLLYGYFYLIGLVMLIGYRIVLRTWHRLRRSTSSSVASILVVGAGRVGVELVAEFQRQRWPGIELVGFLDDDPVKQGTLVLDLPVLGPIERALTIIEQHQIDEVIVALPPQAHTRLANLVANLYETPIRVRVVPDYFELAFFGATVESLAGIPLIGLRDPAIDGFQRFAKRLLDLALSASALILLSPVLLVVAIAIKLEDRGSIFYRAERVGENGQLFWMLKFRSMMVGADKIQPQVNQVDAVGNLVHKQADDPRVTHVGRFIRRTSMDELPQLVNVFKGEMSLVGPRPEMPWLVEKYEPWQRKRFAVPQGITGWWQVNGRSDNLMHLHTDQDLYYIQNYSLWLDLRILWRTVTVVLRGKGAY